MISEKRQRTIYVLTDFLSTNIAIFIFNLVRYYFLNPLIGITFHSLEEYLTSPVVMAEQIAFPIFMLALYGISGYYNNVLLKSRLQELLNTATTAAIGAAVIYLLILINDISPQRRNIYELILVLYGLLFIVVYLPRYIITSICSGKVERGEWGFDTLIVGTTQNATNIEKRLRNTRNKMALRIKGYVDISGRETPKEMNLPVYKLADIAEVCAELGIKDLIVIPHPSGMRATTELVNSLLPLGLGMFITPDLYELMMSRPKIANVASEPLIDITRCSLPSSTANIKRISDIIISAIALILISPILGVLAILIKHGSPGSVIYKQERIGRHKKPFYIYKLRSMAVDAEATGPALSTTNDPRITSIGRLMRKYRLDELPQFWNVLRGDMSLVGPRPEREYYIKQILARAPQYTIMHQVRPGITSWGAVKYGYASSVEEMVERLRYDMLYIENISLAIDLRIIIYTVRTIITGRGI